jgi:hypothetical protein
VTPAEPKGFWTIRGSRRPVVARFLQLLAGWWCQGEISTGSYALDRLHATNASLDAAPRSRPADFPFLNRCTPPRTPPGDFYEKTSRCSVDRPPHPRRRCGWAGENGLRLSNRTCPVAKIDRTAIAVETQVTSSRVGILPDNDKPLSLNRASPFSFNVRICTLRKCRTTRAHGPSLKSPDLQAD